MAAVTLGRGATHRFLTFAFGPDLSLERMMAGEAKGDELSTLYAQGWLLTHYLAFNQERRGQLDGYLKDIAAGIPPVDAAKKNFGSLRKLEGDLRFYLDRKSHPVVKIGTRADQAHPDPGPDSQPRRGGRHAVADRIQGLESMTRKPRKSWPRFGGLPRSYPNDPLVLLTLAEAEIDARNPAASEAAADALLADRFPICGRDDF